MKNFPVFILLLISLLSACNPDQAEDEMPPSVPGYEGGEGVFIFCEGQFLAGNASVDYYRFEDGELESGVYEKVNGIQIGDVLQSGVAFRERVWLVVNNSGFVIGVDPATWEEEVLIEGLRSPRYLLPLGTGKAYLSDLFAGEIHVLDLDRGEKTGSIPVNGWVEEMAMVDGMVFAAGAQTDRLILIDPGTDRVVDSIQVGFAPGQLAVDREGFLWVYCSGEETRDLPAGLYRVDPAARVVEKALVFTDRNLGGWPRLALNPAGDSLYYLKDGLYSMPVNAAFLPEDPAVPSGNHNWYALGIDPAGGEVFLGDAADFQRQGKVVVYEASGHAIDSFLTGVIPNSFLFY